MEGLSSFHTDILMLSCLFDNLKKNNNKSNIFVELRGPLLIYIFDFF